MLDLERAIRRAERERQARKQAEALLEQKALELYRINQELQRARDELEERVNLRTKELEIALQAAERANRTKSEFLANMSHEIRTPMTAILGFADLLLEDELQQADDVIIYNTQIDRPETIRTIQKNGLHLLEIINGILDLSKIEAGKLEVHPVACSVSGIVDHVITMMSVRAEEKNLKLECKNQLVEQDRVLADETRLRQVLVNLIGNAVKFTDAGGVSLTVCSVAGSDSQASMQLQFDVVDSGIGMTEEQIARLFQPFTQADSSTTRRFGGTGLGLTISRKLAKLMGGKLDIVSSQVGEGTHFRLTIPLHPASEAESVLTQSTADLREVTMSSPQSGRSQLEGLKILLAEDGIDNQRLISHILRNAGADVILCENGELAVRRIRQAMEQDEKIDVVLMDMQMPVLDGYQASERLRDIGFTNPIIAITANAMSEDRGKCIEAGCDDYASKPINRPDLLNTIAKHAIKYEEARTEPISIQITYDQLSWFS